MTNYKSSNEILKKELKTPIILIQLIAFPATLGLIYIAYKLHMLIWKEFTLFDTNTFLISIIPMVIIMGILHELIHYASILRKVSREDLEIHFSWKTVTPFVYYKKPLKANTYRIFVASPIIVLGLLPIIIGLAIGNELLTIYGAIGISIGTGDIIELVKTIRVSKNQLIN